jgi:cytochrome c biogenesis protein CcmG, thiol:disulfide interchange protein DsbE
MMFKKVLASIVLCSLTVVSLGRDVKELVGKPAPGFKMTDTRGKTITNASLKGKVVILDFWATWCPPCVAASPTMQKLHEKYAKQGLVVIGANLGERNDPDGTPAKYAKEHKYTYIFTKKNDDYGRKIGILGIPVFMFIDRKGVVRRVETGFGGPSPASFEATVKQLLAK